MRSTLRAAVVDDQHDHRRVPLQRPLRSPGVRLRRVHGDGRVDLQGRVGRTVVCALAHAPPHRRTAAHRRAVGIASIGRPGQAHPPPPAGSRTIGVVRRALDGVISMSGLCAIITSMSSRPHRARRGLDQRPTLVGVLDHPRERGHVRDRPGLEVDDDVRVGRHVVDPRTGAGRRLARDEQATVEVVEVDLDPARLSRAPAGRGEVDDLAAVERGGRGHVGHSAPGRVPRATTVVVQS